MLVFKILLNKSKNQGIDSYSDEVGTIPNSNNLLLSTHNTKSVIIFIKLKQGFEWIYFCNVRPDFYYDI